MGEIPPKPLSTIGFLTVLAHEELGLFGGYLVVNQAGRPLEFHCTTPVKANRAQEILYGPTLEPYIYGELIGQTLLARTMPLPPLILTNVPPALAVAEYVKSPVALVSPALPLPLGEGRGDGAAQTASISTLHGSITTGTVTPKVSPAARGESIEVGPWKLTFADNHGPRQHVVQQLRDAQLRIDLGEPFERIRLAICEAQRISTSVNSPLQQAG
jgi:hypothetical protein